MSFFDDVGAFHIKFGLPNITDTKPHLLDEDAANFRSNFMFEELEEFATACKNGDLPKAADALVDLVYVAVGTAQMMGVPFNACWDMVHRANMQKERAVSADDERSVRKHSLDVVKPEGWKAPDLSRIIEESWTAPDKWDYRFMTLARHVAEWSKDPSTRVGSVLVGKQRAAIAVGFNGFPPGIDDTDLRLRDTKMKYRLMMHSERNVLDNARFDVVGGTLYSTLIPCCECTKSIISRGIGRVVCPPIPDREPWKEEGSWSRMLLQEAGIAIDEVAQS